MGESGISASSLVSRGDVVRVRADADKIPVALAGSGEAVWNDLMADCLGKLGRVVSVVEEEQEEGLVKVMVGQALWTFHQDMLVKQSKVRVKKLDHGACKV